MHMVATGDKHLTYCISKTNIARTIRISSIRSMFSARRVDGRTMKDCSPTMDYIDLILEP